MCIRDRYQRRVHGIADSLKKIQDCINMLIKNAHEENDFVTGHTICTGEIPSWSQRLTSSYGLVLTLAGKGNVSLGDAAVDIEQGDLLLLKPHWKHLFRSCDDWDILWFHFLPRPHIAHALEWLENAPGTGLIHLEDTEFDTVRTALLEAHTLEYQRTHGWNPLAYLLLESVVVRGYNRSICKSESANAWVSLAQRLLTETSDDMDAIASRCGISRASLYTKFKKISGISPRQYREYAILRRAIPLLESLDLSIAEIAERVGMPDQYYFSTRFHKFSGFAPREYRRRAVQETITSSEQMFNVAGWDNSHRHDQVGLCPHLVKRKENQRKNEKSWRSMLYSVIEAKYNYGKRHEQIH
eukprot:TRINITY_DN8780_c0_g1_i1.p1 TRINITY_DN8780_c0_g1~~TRINITY_DN8780_c0_g1_i1.p1  ORF type:complete len:356 (+),score=44.81 TRINITY_DN8780_c0_g1_i1:196-1263(+)